MAVRHIRLASSLAALAIALVAGPAGAQTANIPTALNDQLQWGDVFATMNVVSRHGGRQGATSTATAVGNTVSGANLAGGLDARSRQTMSGATGAIAVLGADDACCLAVAAASAQANAAQAQTVGGDIRLDLGQTADGGDVSSLAHVNLRNTSALSASASSAVNNAVASAGHGTMNAMLRQDSAVSSSAVTDVDACCTAGTVAGATASANTFGISAYTATTHADYTQNSTGATSSAAVDVYQYQGYGVTAASVAAANSATIASQHGYASLRGRQNSETAVRAETRVTLASWRDTAVSSAYAVGNATLATNVGSDLLVDVGQFNSGGVAADASFTGGTAGLESGLAVVSATAIGNAFTGYVCSYCGDANVSGSVSQVNGGAVTSTGTISTTGAGGVIGSATAIGNSATFITTTSRP
ncbi:MAG: holdfast anchor protein HfaD [Alphaproteobacteria bacterium]|nr:holdfast anchor protein HfaD [Alphaproteobacteria bacterium]